MENNVPHIEKIVHDSSYLEKIVTEQNEQFDCLVIKSGSISHLSWYDPEYLKKLFELELFNSVRCNQDNFFEVIATNLQINNYTTVQNITVKNEIICDEPNYLYEIMYVDLEKEVEYQTDLNYNELGSLISTNGDKIYSNAIIFKNYLPSLSESMTLATVTKKNIHDIMFDRVNTRVVIWDNTWHEKRVIGDLTLYADIFFEGEKYEKLEIGFLMHNINIWYLADPYGESVCGNILTKPVEKCIWFTMQTNEIRGNLRLDEVNKIIYLSNILTNYITPDEYTKEKIDSLGRKIIYNKYRILDSMYDKNKNM